MPRNPRAVVLSRRRDRVLRVAHAFGLRPEPPPVRSARPPARVARTLARALARRRVCLVVGPSGAGKSTLLAAVARRLRMRPRAGGGPRALRSRDPVVLLSGLPLDDWLGVLCACGLAEARLWLQPARTLSTGQAARLAAALGAARALRTGRPLILDDFGDHLDAPARWSLACGLARWCRARAVALAVATVHDDLSRVLIADELVRLHPCGDAEGRS